MSVQALAGATAAISKGEQPKEPETILDCHYDHWKRPEVCALL